MVEGEVVACDGVILVVCGLSFLISIVYTALHLHPVRKEKDYDLPGVIGPANLSHGLIDSNRALRSRRDHSLPSCTILGGIRVLMFLKIIICLLGTKNSFKF